MPDDTQEQNEISRGSVVAALDSNGRTIAPWWHTVLLVAPLLGFSLLGSIHPARRALSEHHGTQYLLTLVWEWVLAALVIWGIRMRKVPLRQLLGKHRPTLNDWRDDFLLALSFWMAASILLAAIGVTLKFAHFPMPTKTIAQLAPQNAWQLTVWISLSISAGICEELVFRGYLLQQFTRTSGRVWIGVLTSSLLFGVAHGYEGASGMIAITIYGSLFCLLAMKRYSLRPGMIAHAWHDIFSGVVLMLLKHAQVF